MRVNTVGHALGSLTQVNRVRAGRPLPTPTPRRILRVTVTHTRGL
jgi:hypothetical protein